MFEWMSQSVSECVIVCVHFPQGRYTEEKRHQRLPLHLDIGHNSDSHSFVEYVVCILQLHVSFVLWGSSSAKYEVIFENMYICVLHHVGQCEIYLLSLKSSVIFQAILRNVNFITLNKTWYNRNKAISMMRGISPRPEII